MKEIVEITLKYEMEYEHEEHEKEMMDELRRFPTTGLRGAGIIECSGRSASYSAELVKESTTPA
jgi:hypothetical protein